MKLNKNSLQVFASLPKGWEISRLGEVLPIVYGKGLTKGKRIEIGQIPVYGSSGLVGYHDEALTKKPTLIIGRKGSVGEVYYSKTPCWPIDTVYFAEEHESIHLNYFEHLLRGINLSALDKSTAVPGLSRDDYNAVEVAIAPLNEQHRIVAKIEKLFSELDKGVESLTTAREQLKVYRHALLKHAFEGKLTEQWRTEHAGQLETADQLLARIKKEREKRYQEQLAEWEKAVDDWEETGEKGRKPRKPSISKPLPEISKEEVTKLPSIPPGWQFLRLAEIAQIGSGMSVSKNRKLENPVEVPYLRVANVQRGQLILDEITTMQIEKNMLNELKLKKYDVLFNEGGDRDKLGRGWIWESKIEPCITQNHVFRATTYLGGEYHSKFVSHWGNTFGRDYFETFGKQTTNLASINMTVLSMFPVPISPMKEQKKIIEVIDAIMATVDSFEKDIDDTLAKTQAFRQSILKKAFSGELVPQDPNDEPASELLVRIQAEREDAQRQAKKVHS